MESNQYCSSLVSPVMHIHLCDHCMTFAICICVTFQPVHVAIENANTSHTHAILVVWYHVHGADTLATFKGVYGIANTLHTLHTHIRCAFWPKVYVNTRHKHTKLVLTTFFRMGSNCGQTSWTKYKLPQRARTSRTLNLLKIVCQSVIPFWACCEERGEN